MNRQTTISTGKLERDAKIKNFWNNENGQRRERLKCMAVLLHTGKGNC
jgi:hypothetical protein